MICAQPFFLLRVPPVGFYRSVLRNGERLSSRELTEILTRRYASEIGRLRDGFKVDLRERGIVVAPNRSFPEEICTKAKLKEGVAGSVKGCTVRLKVSFCRRSTIISLVGSRGRVGNTLVRENGKFRVVRSPTIVLTANNFKKLCRSSSGPESISKRKVNVS